MSESSEREETLPARDTRDSIPGRARNGRSVKDDSAEKGSVDPSTPSEESEEFEEILRIAPYGRVSRTSGVDNDLRMCEEAADVVGAEETVSVVAETAVGDRHKISSKLEWLKRIKFNKISRSTSYACTTL